MFSTKLFHVRFSLTLPTRLMLDLNTIFSRVFSKLLLLNLLNVVTTLFSSSQKDSTRRSLVWQANILPLNHQVTDIERIYKITLIQARLICQMGWIPLIHWIQEKFHLIWRKLHCPNNPIDTFSPATGIALRPANMQQQ